MPVIRDWQYLLQDLSAADLELDAKAGQGFEVFEVGIDGGAAESKGIITIGGVTMMNFPASDAKEGVAPVPWIDANPNSLLKMVREKLAEVPTLKIPEGKKLVLSNAGVVGTGYIFYRELSQGEIPRPDAPGAPNNLTRLFVSHGKAEWTATTVENEAHKVDVSLNVPELRDFPFEEAVPAGLRYRLLGFATRLKTPTADTITYEGIRMWFKEQSWLKKEEEWSLPTLFPYNAAAEYYPIRFLPTPMVFEAHQELTLEVQCKNATTPATEPNIVRVTCFFLQEPGR